MSVTTTADGTQDGFGLAKSAGARAPVIIVVEGKQRDLAFVPDGGANVEVVTATDDLGREVIRHSTAHVLAQAVLRLYPGAKYSIGPPIEDGFYYDFDVETPFTPDDLERIEAEMRAIVKENQRFVRREVERDEALALFADQPYKVEIIEGVGNKRADDDLSQQEAADGEVISVYENTPPGADEPAFVDLCRGPHL